jgi:hypothetical protein
VPIFWFIAGLLTALACLTLLLPWLHRHPRFSALPAPPWPVAIAPIVIVTAVIGTHLGAPGDSAATGAGTRPAANASGAPTADASSRSAGAAFEAAARLTGDARTESGGASTAAPRASASPMDTAIANLEGRLAKGNGTADDWELLARSFEFLGRAADAARARARQLPPLGAETVAPAGAPGPSSAAPAVLSSAVSGEILLAPALQGKAAAGETLFIVAKSVESPGVPVAVVRSTVGSWPQKFSLDDTQAMVPGRNLSTSGRVTIEARVSRTGQPLPAPGDLQGSSDAIDPADHNPLRIIIDRVIS